MTGMTGKAKGVVRQIGLSRWLALAGVIIGLDQFTKWLAEQYLVYGEPVPVLPLFNLTLAYNTGAAFSLLAEAGGWQRWLFAGLALVVSVIIIAWLRRLGPKERLTGLALTLILSGALGNLIDRLYLGYVIDFIDVYYGSYHWPAFNIADSAITVGATLLVISSLFGGPRRSS